MAKITTKITSFSDVQKSLQEIEKVLNELTQSVNSSAETEVSDKDGKTGDIKTQRNADGTYSFEVKTDEGWKVPALGNSLIKFKDKLNTIRQTTPKSIEELDESDASTGDSTANLTTFDEKNNKFILPRADFDSGWQTWTRADHDQSDNTPLKIEHGLEVLPTMIIGYFAPGQSANAVTFFTPIKNDRGYGYDNGIGLFVDNTRVYFYGGDSNSLAGIPTPSTTSNCDGQAWDDGCVRVLVWK